MRSGRFKNIRTEGQTGRGIDIEAGKIRPPRWNVERMSWDWRGSRRCVWERGIAQGAESTDFGTVDSD